MSGISERVLQRMAKYEMSPEEWEKYKAKYPGADKSKHKIVRKDAPKPPPIPDAAKKKKPITPPVPESAHKKTVPPPAQKPEAVQPKPEAPKPAAPKPEVQPPPAAKHDEHHDEHDDHEPAGAKPGRMEAWKDRLKGLSEKAAKFVSDAPKSVKSFLGDPEFRKNTLKEAGKHLTGKALKKRVMDTVKEEVHEYKTAAKGVRKVLSGGKMNKHEKHAFRTVATHLAIGGAAAAFAATGPLMGAAIFAKGMARQIALKSVKKSLENVHLLDELGHVGHGISHFLEHVAAEKQDADPDEAMANLVLACVAKELENLSDEDLTQMLNGLEDDSDDQESDSQEKTASQRVLSRFVGAGYSGWDPPEGPEEPDPSEEWNDVTKQFPHALQKLLGDPRPKSDHGFGDITVTMTAMVELGEDSGVELTVTSSHSEDADEDGPYTHSSTDTEYFFWIGHQHWSGTIRPGQNYQHLKQHLRDFAKHLEQKDPDGAKKAGF